jgi:drug/metabolite transporter (DMT)-like permease
MAPPMFRLVLTRLILAAAPFAAYWLWREHALRTGRPMGSTPWGWLVAIAGALVAVSLLASGLVQRDNRGMAYAPAEASADGGVAKGRFDTERARP